jgi:hypothetical protein
LIEIIIEIITLIVTLVVGPLLVPTLLRTVVVVIVDEVQVLHGLWAALASVACVATFFTCHASIVDLHDLLGLRISILELLHYKVHFGKQHVYLLQLVHSSLAGWLTVFVPALVGSHLLHKVCSFGYCE